MSQKIDEPYSSGMRFFTPELYVSFNSSDDDEADRANGIWEVAIQQYQRHVDGFRLAMPYQLRNLSDLCLHDAELVSVQYGALLDVKEEASVDLQTSKSPANHAVLLITLQMDQEAILLIYFLWECVRQSPPVQPWPFSRSHIHWLYDEFDLASDRRDCFWHRILVSNGLVIEIPVRDVLAIQLPAPVLK